MEKQISRAMPHPHPDLPIEAACPVCGVGVRMQIKYNNEFNNLMIFLRTQKEMRSLAGSYTYKGESTCSCGKLLRVHLSITARDIKERDGTQNGTVQDFV